MAEKEGPDSHVVRKTTTRIMEPFPTETEALIMSWKRKDMRS